MMIEPHASHTVPHQCIQPQQPLQLLLMTRLLQLHAIELFPMRRTPFVPHRSVFTANFMGYGFLITASNVRCNRTHHQRPVGERDIAAVP